MSTSSYPQPTQENEFLQWALSLYGFKMNYETSSKLLRKLEKEKSNKTN